MATRLVNITSTSADSATGSWTDVVDLTASSITVQGTSSVLLLIATVPMAEAADTTADFRFTVNGVATGSPINHAFADNTASGEADGMTLMWAVDGLSGSSNSFAVQWLGRVGTASVETTDPRSFQVIEFASGAEIIVDQTGTSLGNSPASIGSLLSQSSVTVTAGSSLLMIGNIPIDGSGTDGTLRAQFGIDATPEGPSTFFSNDTTNECCGGDLVYFKEGVSGGSHSFELNWTHISGSAIAQSTSRLASFQVIEITAPRTTHYNQTTSSTWATTTTWANDPTLDTDETIGSTTAVVLIGAQAAAAATGTDSCIDVRIGIDDTNASGMNRYYQDSTAMYNGGALIWATTGISGSKSFQLRARELISGDINTAFLRQLWVLELPNEGISGVTDPFDFDTSSVTLTGQGFAATEGSSTVHLSPNDLLSEAGEVDISAAVNTWSDTSINLDMTLLSAATLTSLHTMGPGARFIIVNVGGVPGTTEYFKGVTVHRPQAFKMSLGAGTPGASTSRLTTLDYGVLTGVDDDSFTTPDAAKFDLTGDLTLEFDGALNDWTGSTDPQVLVAKWEVTGNQRSYRFFVRGGASSGILRLDVSTNGTAVSSHDSSVAIDFSAYSRHRIRARFDADNGASGSSVFFEEYDNVTSTWDQIGAEATNAGTKTVYSSTAIVEVGDSGGADNAALGRVWAAKIYNATPTLIGDFDPDGHAAASSWVASTGETWTVAGGTSVVSVGTFDAGRFEEAANPATTVDITADDYTEMVWSIEAKTLAREVQYDFRVTQSGTVLDTYTVTPKTTVTGGDQAALTGVSGTSAVGTLLNGARSLLLSGLVATSAVGAVGNSVTVGLSGVSSTSNVGSVGITKSASLALTGIESTGAVGSVAFTKSGSLGITGIEITSGIGDVGLSASGSYALIGIEATSAVGDVGFSIGGSAVLSGIEATSAVGSVDNETEVVPSGVEGTSADGSLGNQAKTALTGTENASAVGTIQASAAGGASIIGVEAVSAVGSVSFTESGSVGLTGAESTAEVGTVSVSAGSTIAVTGVEAIAEVGSVGFTESGQVAVSGVEATADVGSVGFTESGSAELSGIEATASVGTVGASASATKNITGVESTAEVGTVSFTESGQVALSGIEITSDVGSVGALSSVSITGVSSTGSAGDLNNSISFSITGIQGVSDVGILGFTESGQASLTGVSVTASVGAFLASTPSRTIPSSRLKVIDHESRVDLTEAESTIDIIDEENRIYPVIWEERS